jgi:uncharacterized protein YjiS (DUF1127 family)
MSLIPERLSAGCGRSFAAIGLDPALPAVRRTPEGGIDFDWYLVRARRLRSEAYAGYVRALWRGLGAALAGRFKAYRAWRARGRAVAQLLNLDERGLRDIDLNRASIYFAVDHGREDAPAPANANAAPARSPKAA